MRDPVVTLPQALAADIDAWVVLARALKPWHLRTLPPVCPEFTVAGRWLEHAGFHTGQRLRIAVEPGRLVITPE